MAGNEKKGKAVVKNPGINAGASALGLPPKASLPSQSRAHSQRQGSSGKTAREKDVGKAKAVAKLQNSADSAICRNSVSAKEKAAGSKEVHEKKTGTKEKTRVAQTSGPGEKAVHSAEAKEKGGHAKSEKVHRKEKRAKGDAEKRLAKIKGMIKKKLKPHFKGMFGNRQMRNVSDAKWNRWRHPSGIDVRRLREHGLWPSTGYRTPKAIRYLHPSGTTVTLVHNTKELDAVGKGIAARIASKVGGKKRVQIIALAKQKGIRVLNA